MYSPYVREIYRHIPSCETCIYFIKKTTPLLSQCKLFDKKSALFCRIDNTCGIEGRYYKEVSEKN